MLLRNQNESLKMDLGAREHQLKLFESQCAQRERANDNSERKISDLEKKLKKAERDGSDKERMIAQKDIEMERMKQKVHEVLRNEQARIRRIYEKELAEKEARLTRENCINQERINRVHEILCADMHDFEIGEADLHANLRRCTSPGPGDMAGSGTGSSGLPGKQPPADSNSTPSRTLHASADKLRSKSQSAVTKAKSGYPSSEYDILHNKQLSTFNDDDAKNRPPTSNPRHRRSLSTGNEKWIDHRPPGTMDLGTVLQPHMKNKRSLSNLKNVTAANLKDASKYALTHHSADNYGNVETEVYKGEIIPTVGGGAQVIFQDVETLRQSSPPGR